MKQAGFKAMALVAVMICILFYTNFNRVNFLNNSLSLLGIVYGDLILLAQGFYL
jgi:hypothetical protein